MIVHRHATLNQVDCWLFAPEQRTEGAEQAMLRSRPAQPRTGRASLAGICHRMLGPRRGMLSAVRSSLPFELRTTEATQLRPC